MRNGTRDLLSKILSYSLCIFFVYYIVVYIIVVFFRIQYPFELEWMEGGSVEHVLRILSGKKIYVSPSLEFVPYLYPPLYYYVSALLSKMIGVGFFPLRVISFTSSLLCFILISLFVRRETGNLFAGLAASGLFAAVFKVSEAWYDIARVDSLFLFLLLLSVYLLKFRKEAKFHLLAGFLLGLSFLTKQTALFISLPLCVYFIWSLKSRSFYFFVTLLLTMAGASIFLNYIHDGWYNFYVFDLPRVMFAERLVVDNFLGFWLNDLLFTLPVALIMSILYLISQLRDSGYKNFLFYSLFAVGMTGASFLPRLQIGSAANVLMPVYAVISILFGLAVHTFVRLYQGKSGTKTSLIVIGIYSVSILQLGCLLYDPVDQVPTRRDLEAGKRLTSIVSGIEGDILFPFHGFIGEVFREDDRQSRVLDVVCPMSVINILGYIDPKLKYDLTLEIKRAIREKRFSAVILDKYWFQKDIEEHYRIERRIFTDNDVFWPVTGWQTRPEVIYIPRSKTGE